VADNLVRDEVPVLLSARLERELGSLLVQYLGVLELDGLEKGGRGELVHVVAVVFHMQLVGSADMKRELARLETVVGSDEANDRRVGRVGEHGGAENERGEDGSYHRDHRNLHPRILPRNLAAARSKRLAVQVLCPLHLDADAEALLLRVPILFGLDESRPDLFVHWPRLENLRGAVEACDAALWKEPALAQGRLSQEHGHLDPVRQISVR